MTDTIATVEKFNSAFNRHDVAAVMELMTEDCVFEAEEVFAAGDRCVVRWIYHKTKEGKPWHLRGVDVFKVADGKVAEKLAYVKG